MKKKLSILIIFLALIAGCSIETSSGNNVITLAENQYTISIGDYEFKTLGSGFLIFVGDNVATGQFVDSEQVDGIKEHVIENNLDVIDEEDIFVYREGGTEEDNAITYTAIKAVDDNYSYLVSYTNIETLLNIMAEFEFSHITVTVPPTPTEDPNAVKEVHTHEH